MSQSIQDDKIDLFELFANLWVGKWLIVLSTVLFVIGGYAYSQLATKIYQLEAKLQAPACPKSGVGYLVWDEDFDETVASFSWDYPKITLQLTEPKSLQFYQELLDGVLDEISTDLSAEVSRVQKILAQTSYG